MVYFMAETSCQKFCALDNYFIHIFIKSLNLCIIRSCHNAHFSWNRKAALLTCLFSACLKNFRINKYQWLVTAVNYNYSFSYSYLWCSKSASVCIIHSFKHVID